MRYFATEYDRYSKMLAKFAAYINVVVNNDRIIYPPSVGKGFIQALKLPNGLDIAYFQNIMQSTFSFKRKGTKKEYYILWICDCVSDSDLEFELVSEKVNKTCQCAIAALLNSKDDFRYTHCDGTFGRGISISLVPEWLHRYLGLDKNGMLLNDYFGLKGGSFDKVGLDTESRRLLKEIVHLEIDTPFKVHQLQTRVMLLVERFFINLAHKMDKSYRKIRMSSNDIKQIIHAENLLTHDFSKKAPTISELSKMAGMSVTKFKNNFKEVFEMPVYQYYQTRRMESAKERILVDSKCISCVSREYGFASISNFTSAFKKQFRYLPSDLKKNTDPGYINNN